MENGLGEYGCSGGSGGVVGRRRKGTMNEKFYGTQLCHYMHHCKPLLEKKKII